MSTLPARNSAAKPPKPYKPAPWEDAFFEAYMGRFGVIPQAAAEAGITSQTLSRRKATHPEFRAKLKAAEASVAGLLEYRAMSLAFDGYERPVFHRGNLIQMVREYDTRHLEWMLERMMPEKYHLPERVRLEGAGGEAVRFVFEMGEKDDEPVDGEVVEGAQWELEEGAEAESGE